MVVDDAIVVVENVERNMHQHHLDPKEATIRSMEEISTSLVAVVLVMSSVFIPAAFLPGTTGQLYKQFAITIVISVSVSGFVALTLTPAMCALMLKHNPPPQRGPFAWFNRQVDNLTAGFGHAVVFVIRRMVIAFILFAVFLYAIWHFFHILPTSFVPQEDQGYAMAAIVMPPGASLDRTQAVAEKVDAIFAGIPGVENRAMVSGYSLLDSGYKTNAGTFFITFKDFEQRGQVDVVAPVGEPEVVHEADDDGRKHEADPAEGLRVLAERALVQGVVDEGCQEGHRDHRDGTRAPAHLGLEGDGAVIEDEQEQEHDGRAITDNRQPAGRPVWWEQCDHGSEIAR
jgi:multidrug efflux pump subunit AcrB